MYLGTKEEIRKEGKQEKQKTPGLHHNLALSQQKVHMLISFNEKVFSVVRI